MGIGLGKISPSTFDYQQPGCAPSQRYANPGGSPIIVNNQVIVPFPPPNPNPLRWELIESYQQGDYLIVKVRYLDCTNYEGVKILVFKGIAVEILVVQGVCDPHFSENPNLHSPIARFVPTQEGMDMARRFVEMMDEQRDSSAH